MAEGVAAVAGILTGRKRKKRVRRARRRKEAMIIMAAKKPARLKRSMILKWEQ